MERTLHQYQQRSGAVETKMRRRCPRKRSSTDLPPRDGPAPTVGSRHNFESRGARRMAGKDSTQGPFTPPLAFDNRVKVHKGDQGGGRKSFFCGTRSPRNPRRRRRRRTTTISSINCGRGSERNTSRRRRRRGEQPSGKNGAAPSTRRSLLLDPCPCGRSRMYYDCV